MTAPRVRATGLKKRFRPPASLRELARGRLHGAPVTALDGVDLEVEPGEVVGLMGPNGAGKSTLLRILAGVVSADEGAATVDGLDCARGGPRLASRVGWVAADERGLHPALPPREYLAFFAALHGNSRRAALARADQLLDEVGLTEAARRPLGELSTGMRRRCALARALVGAPALLVVDEPTRGVDPPGALVLRAHLRAQTERGVSIVMATHDIDEARALCRRVAVMERGRFVAVEAPERAAARWAHG